MREQRVSSVLLVENGKLMGLVTDRDLRNRVLAEQLDPALPVRGIATLAPHTLQAHSPTFEAMLLMARANIHHVPVMDGAQLVGMVTATDLAEQQSTSAVVLAGEIHKQTTAAGLAQTTTRLKALQRHLADADASAYSTGHIVTAITEQRVAVRLHDQAGGVGRGQEFEPRLGVALREEFGRVHAAPGRRFSRPFPWRPRPAPARPAIPRPGAPRPWRPAG